MPRSTASISSGLSCAAGMIRFTEPTASADSELAGPLAVYFRDIARAEIMSREQECVLAGRIDELRRSDRSPVELGDMLDMPSNLLAHHLDVLEQVGLIERSRSSGDGRRRYVHLRLGALEELYEVEDERAEGNRIGARTLGFWRAAAGAPSRPEA